jgi:hypothetical protein
MENSSNAFFKNNKLRVQKKLKGYITLKYMHLISQISQTSQISQIS